MICFRFSLELLHETRNVKLTFVDVPCGAAVRAQHMEYLFGAPTRRQKGPRSAMMERFRFHNVVLESLDLILELPRTYFEPSGRCFWASE